MNRAETRLVAPFYLDMMGSNALWLHVRKRRRLVRRGRTVSLEDVHYLLSGGSLEMTQGDRVFLHWRPVVMGAWLSLRFEPDEVKDALLYSLDHTAGDLTALPLASATVILVGSESAGTLRSNRLRSMDREAHTVAYLDAALESLGEAPENAVDDDVRASFAELIAFGRQLRKDLRPHGG